MSLENLNMTERKVIGKEKTCGKCGGSLRFYRNERGNYVPCNPDGSDHWDSCREAQVKGTYGIKRIFRQKIEGCKTSGHAVGYQNKEHSYYCGTAAPWDFKDMIYCVHDGKELNLLLADKTERMLVSKDSKFIWTDGKATCSFYRRDI